MYYTDTCKNHCAECGKRIDDAAIKAYGIIPVCSNQCEKRAEDHIAKMIYPDIVNNDAIAGRVRT